MEVAVLPGLLWGSDMRCYCTSLHGWDGDQIQAIKCSLAKLGICIVRHSGISAIAQLFSLGKQGGSTTVGGNATVGLRAS